MAAFKSRYAMDPSGPGDAQIPRVSLIDIKPRHERALCRITSQEDVMKNVGGRRPWTAYMVRKFINYNAEEQKQRRGREYFYWGVEDKGALVGIVGIHPVLYGRPDTEGLSFVTIFLDSAHSGRGVGTAALREAMRRFHEARDDPIYADVYEDNSASLALLKKLGFAEVDRLMISTEMLIRLKADAFG